MYKALVDALFVSLERNSQFSYKFGITKVFADADLTVVSVK